MFDSGCQLCAVVNSQTLAYEACDHTRMPKTLKTCKKKACLVWLKKLHGVQQIAHLKQHCFLPPTFYKIQRSYEKKFLFVILLVHWWKFYYIYIFFTQSMTDFDKLKRNISDATIIFLMPLLITLTWKILLLFSF